VQIQPATAGPNHVFTNGQGETQSYGTVNHALPLDLEEPVRLEMTEQLNQLLYWHNLSMRPPRDTTSAEDVLLLWAIPMVQISPPV
jgi:hypothetical protein